MDTKVRKLITCHRMHHPRADIECMYVKRKTRKRFIQLRLKYKKNHYRIKEILRRYKRLDATVNKHRREAKKKTYTISKESHEFDYQLDLKPKEIDIKDKTIKAAKREKKKKKQNLSLNQFLKIHAR